MSTQSEGLRAWVAGRAPPTAELPAEDGFRIVVGSGKGGVGTSTVAALLALLGSATSRSVLLVDGDENLGALHFLLGAEPRHWLGSLRGGAVEPRDLLVPLTPTLTLLPGGGFAGNAGDAPLSAAERRALFRRVAALFGAYDLVVVDGGSRLDSVLSICAAGADRVLAVTAAERISVAATYALAKALAERAPDLPVEILVNRADERLAGQTAEEIRAAVSHFLERSVGFAGAVPDDACLRAGMDAGMRLQDAAAGSPAADALCAICEHLLGSLNPTTVLPSLRSA